MAFNENKGQINRHPCIDCLKPWEAMLCEMVRIVHVMSCLMDDGTSVKHEHAKVNPD